MPVDTFDIGSGTYNCVGAGELIIELWGGGGGGGGAKTEEDGGNGGHGRVRFTFTPSGGGSIANSVAWSMFTR